MPIMMAQAQAQAQGVPSSLASEEIELQVVREGKNKTAIVNFNVICLAMNRPPEHVSAFLLNELGTYGAMDGQQRLVVKGRFLPSSVNAALLRYIHTTNM
jgi:translation initiation factor 2 beta subunit (eIF-2beta)/eIF-5